MVSIVIPLYNQVKYTRLCIDSLRQSGLEGIDVLLIDNASTDDTAEFLKTCADMRVIRNEENLGCSGAWNQGVQNTESDWIVILNNDVVVPPGWLQGLVSFAVDHGYDIVSPAIREGELNYPVEEYAAEFVNRMHRVVRSGVADGICFMAHRKVFDKIGGFDEGFRIGQFEDADFFRRARLAGFKLATTGQSFIHHFGSVTQKSLQKKKVVKSYVEENRAYYRKKWKLNWWRRFYERRVRKLKESVWIKSELKHGHTLKEKWIDGRLRYF